ncbi:TrmH family RNA methyltransferase [Patescibacteria group bacterium]
MKFKKYNKKMDISYTYGTFPTIDLLLKKPEIVKTVLLHPMGAGSSGEKRIKSLCEKNNIRYEIASKAIGRISAKENTYAIGVFKKYTSSLDSGENHVVLVNPSSPGNLGTIVRSMVGFNILNLGIIKPATDIFDPKVVRSSMGSNFDLRFEYFDDFKDYSRKFPGYNLYPFILEGGKKVEDVTFKKPFTLIFGKESSGLPDNFKKMGTGVYIPHTKKIDSLNLSIAASIGIYESIK